MKNYVFRVFYFGTNYQGFQRQLNGQTVENHIEFSLIMSDLIHSFQKNQYRSCSRTDQGVHALANVFSIFCANTPVLPHINWFLPNNIIIWSFAEVPNDFNPRHKVTKQYRYYLPKDLVSTASDLSRIFDYRGTHDFTSFIKKHGAGMDYPITQISDICINDNGKFHIIDIIGDSFGREQIRRMIGFLIQEKYANISLRDVFENQLDLDIKSSPPYYLVLYSIDYDYYIAWKTHPKMLKQVSLQIENYQIPSLEDQIRLNLVTELKDLLKVSNMG